MDTFEPRPDFEDDTDLSELVSEPVDEGFSPETRNDFFGLTMIGFLEEEFDLYGHKIQIRTLRAGEELACALVIKEYQDSIGQGKAGYCSQVAAAIVLVDGQPLPRSLGNDVRADIRERFNYVIENYDFDTVIRPIWTRWQMLNERKILVAEELLSK